MDQQPKTKNKNSLIAQLFNFGMGPIIGMGISMLTVPVTTRLLIPEEFGRTSMFTLVQTVFNLIVLLGLDQSYVRFYNQKDIDRKELLYSCLLLPVSFCAVLILLTICFARNISDFMFGSWEPNIMILFVVFLPTILFNRFALLTIRMDLRGKLYSALNVIQQLLNFCILLFFLLYYEKSFRSVIYSSIISALVITSIAIILSKQFIPVKIFKINKVLIKELLLFGLPLIPATILSWVMNSFDKLSLRMWGSFEELGLYAAAFKIVSLVALFQTIFTTTWTPIAYKWYEEKVEDKKFEDVGTLVVSFMTMVFAGVILFRDIIMLFLGSEYRGTSSIFVFLLFSPILYTVSEVTSVGIGFKKKTIYSLYIAIIAAVLNILGNYLLVPRLGAQGAAISTCISYIAFFWARTFFSRSVWFKFGLLKYVINILILIAYGINMVTITSKLIEILLFVFLLIYDGVLVYKVLKPIYLNKIKNKEAE